jgi:hypothetical protein
MEVSMTLLRQRMLEELQRHNYSQATIESYILSVKDFAEYFHKSPDLLGAEEVRRYQLYLINNKKLAAQTVKVRMSALRFFYWKTLKRRDLYFDDLPPAENPEEITHGAQSRGDHPTDPGCIKRDASHDPDTSLRYRYASGRIEMVAGERHR